MIACIAGAVRLRHPITKFTGFRVETPRGDGTSVDRDVAVDEFFPDHRIDVEGAASVEDLPDM